MSDEVLREYYCHECGSFLGGDDSQNELALRLVIYVLCTKCALKKYKEMHKDKGGCDEENQDG